MTEQADYKILLYEVVKSAKAAAADARARGESSLQFGYYDILDVVKTQAEILAVPLADIGLEGVDIDEYLPR